MKEHYYPNEKQIYIIEIFDASWCRVSGQSPALYRSNLKVIRDSSESNPRFYDLMLVGVALQKPKSKFINSIDIACWTVVP